MFSGKDIFEKIGMISVAYQFIPESLLSLETYYGAQLLETVVDDEEHIIFRSAVNAELNRGNLVESLKG